MIKKIRQRFITADILTDLLKGKNRSGVLFEAGAVEVELCFDNDDTATRPGYERVKITAASLAQLFDRAQTRMRRARIDNRANKKTSGR